MDNIYLMGAEDVRRAGSSMIAAASSMQSAASQIEYSLRRHREFLDDWLARLENIMKKEGK